MGSIASNKEISEAVVAIPYMVKGGTKQTFKISREAIHQAELIVKGAQPGGAGGLPEQVLCDSSIVDMVRKMQKYVIPPHMDFVKFKPDSIIGGSSGINAFDEEQIPGGPFAMYIFEFKQTLNKQDLANIWQNLPPTSIGASPFYHESDEVSISHQVFNTAKLNLINGQKILENKKQISKSQEIVEDIQWMVFKVKKRAATNYFEKTTDLNDGGQFEFQFDNQPKFPNITYNWPYDFFSMVELVKLDADITMRPDVLSADAKGIVKKMTEAIDNEYGAPVENDEGDQPPPNLALIRGTGRVVDLDTISEVVRSATTPGITPGALGAGSRNRSDDDDSNRSR